MGQLKIDLNARFDGSDFIHKFDQERLTGQMQRIYNLMIDGKFRTLRKERFGYHILEKQRRGEPSNGLFEYRVLPCQ